MVMNQKSKKKEKENHIFNVGNKMNELPVTENTREGDNLV